MPLRLILLATLVALTLCPSPAVAGTYDVYSCRLPDGSPAPTTGWTPLEHVDAPGARALTADGCANHGGLTATLPVDAAIPAYAPTAAAWTFGAPDDTTIAGFVLHRSARSTYSPAGSGAADYVSTFDQWPPGAPASGFPAADGAPEDCLAGAPSGVDTCTALGSAGEPMASANAYTRSGIGVGRLTLGVVCHGWWASADGVCLGSGESADLQIYAAQLTLRDPVAPSFTSGLEVTGGALADGRLRVSFTAADRGGGLLDAALMVDGSEATRVPLGAAGARCQQPYVEPVPCPLARDVVIPLDTATLTPDAHTFEVALNDVAGNRTLSGPVVARIENDVATRSSANILDRSNGTRATRFARLRSWFEGRSKRIAQTVAYGASPRVEGVLESTAGTPIGGATLVVEERPAGVTRRAKAATVTTDAKGRFSYRVSPGPSRVVQISYRAFLDDPAPVASAQTTLHVRAGVSLKVSPTHVRNGSVIEFAGRVLGERGTRRAIVTIYALAGGPRERIPVETLRAGADGRFVYRYRFRSIPAPSTYRCEARVLKQTGFP